MADSYILAKIIMNGKLVWCQSQLAVAIDENALEMTILAGRGELMPEVYPFFLLCENEIIGCTDRAGDVLSIVRGVNDTDPAPHAFAKVVRVIIRSDDVYDALRDRHDGDAQDTAIAGKATLAEIKTDTDIADALSKKHSNSLDHDGSAQDSAIAGKEPANANIQAHVTAQHAPSNAQKNSDITKGEIEAKLIGEIASHTHAGGGSLPTPICITLWQDAALTAWTNMPAALTEFRAILNTRTKIDLTTALQSRITVRVGVAPVANAKIKVQYSTDESVWVDLCSVTMPATANKTNVGSWTDVPAGAKADVFVRLVGIDGNASADPTFGLITLQVK